MENAYIWLKIAIAIITFLIVTGIPTVIALVQKVKAYKKAKETASTATTEAEKAAAEAEAEKIKNELLGHVNEFIANAETTYKDIDAILKDQGKSGCGAAKKEVVLTKIQAFCLEKGIEYDAEYWSAKVDELVALTKSVNAKTGA